ncbi:MAG: InlB B-repeat-containing protein, partial [Saccharofermentanales bacterium]
VTAVYDINVFTVTFKDWNGTNLKIENVNYGADATAPANPSRTGYTFVSWDVGYTNITADLIVTALYTINSYTVTFKNWDGTELKIENVSYGADATAPANPSRTGYTFVSWDVGYTNITADLIVTALYTINSYTVTFKNWDGTELKIENVSYGADATAPANPSRTGYTFVSWDVGYTNITADLIVTAVYDINVFTVTFKDWDGIELKTENVSYGADATPPADPSRTGYTFTGWDVGYTNITADIIVTALYIINRYTVTFKDWNGTNLKIENVSYGADATPPANPTRTGYTFVGWDVGYTNITADLIVTAVYDINSYTVTFKDWNGTDIKIENVNYGADAIAPANPTRTGYAFTGWDVAFTNITADLIITAVYDINVFTVTFKDWNGTNLKIENVNYGADATAPANPSRTGYTFVSWNTSFNNITANLTVTALYTINRYTVTFKDWNSTDLKTEQVDYGQGATAPANPSRTGYTFVSWNTSFNNITTNLIVTALYTINNYTITFNAQGGSSTANKTADYNTLITAPAAPNRTEYNFLGWYRDAAGVSPWNFTTDKVIANITLYAKWEIDIPDTVTSSTYFINESKSYVSKIGIGTSSETFRNGFYEKKFLGLFKGTQEILGSGLAGTGMLLKIMDGTTIQRSFTVVVTGDINGDGKITLTDFVQLKSHLLSKTRLAGVFALAADVNGDGKITLTDFVKAKAHLLGKEWITPQAY